MVSEKNVPTNAFTGLVSPNIMKSEEIKEGAKSALAIPANDAESHGGSSFRVNAPNVAIMSLKSI